MYKLQTRIFKLALLALFKNLLKKSKKINTDIPTKTDILK